MDIDTVHLLCTENFRSGNDDVSVKEITKKTLNNTHKIYTEMVEKLFIPYDEYPNIK
jgi:hypothetical protein